MNKKLTYLLSALGLSAVSALMMSACRDYDVFDEGEATLAKVDKQYDEAFFKAFGQIDPNQDFGMKEPLKPMGWGGRVTRAGDVNVQRNMWVKNWANDDPNNPYDTDALAHDIVIPGWPNFDGLYYGNYGGSVIQNMWTNENLPNGAQPCGDVTDYEIQYVSAWFRSNKNPGSNCELHLSDFFIQNVSCDNDQMEYTSLSNGLTGTNGRNVLYGTDNPTNVTRKSGSHEVINFALDQLGFQGMDEQWTHVNNFNNQNSNYDPEEATTTNNREIKYITSSGTEAFRCHPSFSTSSETEWIKSYVLRHLEWMEPDQNGTMHHREGYYLAFDFQAKKDETQVACDGYYSNWIVKITPGNFEPTGVAKRVMCEDLGGTFDFDFNDVVFDVAISGSDAVISVQAAGGTMPIYLAGKTDEKYEIHTLLGSNTSTQPINVLGDYTHQHAPAIFRVPNSSISTAEDIDIMVSNNGEKYHVNGKRDKDADPNSNLDDQEKNPYGSPTNKVGTIAPRAFAVPTSVKWMKELVYIDKSYPGFKHWAVDKTFKYNQSSGDPLEWYDESKVQADDHPSTSFTYWPGTILNTDGLPKGWHQATPEGWQTLTPIEETFTHATAVGALGAIKIYGYTGNGSIIYNFTNNNATIVTLTAILKSNVEYVEPTYDIHGKLTNGESIIQAIMIPADDLSEAEETAHPEMTMEYKGNYFNASRIQDYRIAPFQNYTGQDENTQMPDGHNSFEGLTHTYAIKMTFEKSQLMTDPEKYVDYINLFVKVPEGKTAKVFNWHVHY